MGETDRSIKTKKWIKANARAIAVVIVLIGTTFAIGWWFLRTSPSHSDLAFARGNFRAVLTAGTDSIDDLRRSHFVDLIFALVYGTLLCTVIWCFGSLRTLGRRPYRIAGLVVVAVAVIADVVETLLVLSILDDPASLPGGWEDSARVAAFFAVVKWVCIGGVLYYLFLRAISPRAMPKVSTRSRVPTPADLKTGEWLPPDIGAERRIGIACSGGGIRSASFSLGALQAADASTGGGGLEHVQYVGAVSGGGYTAGGWAGAANAPERLVGGATTPPTTRQPPVFAPGSPEEERLRRNTSLLPDARAAVGGFTRLTMGLAINLLLIWGLLIAVVAPVGWLISSPVVHPELRSRTPLVEIKEQPKIVRDNRYVPERDVPDVSSPESTPTRPTTATTSVVGSTPVTVPIDETVIPPLIDGFTRIEAQPCSLETCPAWTVDGLQLTETSIDAWTFDGQEFEHEAMVELDPDRPAIVIVEDSQLRVIQQPRVVVEPGALDIGRGGAADEDIPTLDVERQPELATTGNPAAWPTAENLRVAEDPVLTQRSRTSGRDDLEIAGWMWLLCVGLLAIAILIGIARIVARPVEPTKTKWLRRAVRISSSLAAAAALVFVVLPWLTVTLPSALRELPDWLPLLGEADVTGSTLINTTFLAFIITLLETGARLLRGPVTSAARKWPMRVARIAVVVLVTLVTVTVIADILEIAAANGPFGHLSDIGPMNGEWIRDIGPIESFGPPDWVRWLIVVTLLAGWARIADAHAWSLFPFYKRWLGRAFVSRRASGETPTGFPPAPEPAEEMKYEIELDWPGNGRLGPAGPELLLCCAVNLSAPGEAASGRRAGTFVFSAKHVGGPDVGWIPTADYLDHLPERRRKDTTLLATMAISGAAFSPGMGKKSMGAIGGLMAIANARLGVWLPHPRAVESLMKKCDEPQCKEKPCTEHQTGAQQTDQEVEPVADDHLKWSGRPGWPWWAREVVLRFRGDAPYLYVSDGGHWENLGLVELLRRGCNRVYVVSAAGDGTSGFGTIGEAIALAREELGIEIEGLELDQLRPPTDERDDDEEVLVLADGTIRRFAPATHTIGTLRRIGQAEPYGEIIALEANLTADVPWDVQAHAEKNAQFPDDSTLDQFFDDEQFESYRRLGQFQMERALADVPLDGAAIGSDTCPLWQARSAGAAPR